MKIVEFLRPDAVIEHLAGRTAPEVLAELCRPVAAAAGLDAGKLLQTLLDREKLGSTGIGEGVAIPHAKLAALPVLTAAFGRAPEGIDFRAIDGRPARLFFALFAPESSAGVHLKALARVSRIFRSPAFREAILAAPDAAAIYRLIETEDARE
ncbi:MAG TPA: PTS sugar transporter subunit IIA [Anaeromyxobacteraceae bacterium]|nr:PTS sugar transporter subunit IIA [Anaeromyxobacteraceae bacterium]